MGVKAAEVMLSACWTLQAKAMAWRPFATQVHRPAGEGREEGRGGSESSRSRVICVLQAAGKGDGMVALYNLSAGQQGRAGNKGGGE